jgi:DNA repair protein SbcC/Rad50
MKLESLRLVNIRAFEDSGEIRFQDGTISVYGENGVGKSTIVNSIGRTIFGWEGDGVRHAVIDYEGERHKQGAIESILRKGAVEGSIDVTFSHKGHLYRVKNVLSRKAQSWELFLDGERADLFGKQEIHERIRDELGISETHATTAESLFSDVICVLQGQVVNEFEFTAQRRKDHFDKVLGLYSYRQAYSDSIHVKNNFKGKIGRAESDARVIDAEIAHLSALVDRLRASEEELKDLHQSIGHVESKLSSTENQKQAYESHRVALERLKTELSATELKAEDLATLSEASLQDVQKSREARKVVKRLEPSYSRYKDIATQLEELKGLIQQVGREKTRLSQLRVDHARVTSVKANMLEELQKFDEAANRAAQLSSIAVEHQRLVETLSQLQRDEERYLSILEGITSIENKLQESRTAVEAIEADFAERNALEARANTLETLSREYDELAKKIGELGGYKKQLEKDLDSLLNGICPYTSDRCESIEARGHRDEHKLETTKVELAQLQSERDAMVVTISDARNAVQELQLLDSKQRELELRNSEVKTLSAELTKERGRADEIRQNLLQKKPLEEHIDALKSSAEEYRSLEYLLKKSDRVALVNRRDELRKRDEELQQEMEATAGVIADLTERGGDDAFVSRLEGELRGLQTDYDQYVKSWDLANSLETVTERHNKYVMDLATLIDRQRRLAAEIDTESKHYDEREHMQVEREWVETSKRLNEMRGVAFQLSRQIEELKPRAADLVVKKEDLMALDVELNEIEADGKFFDEIRESFKNLSAMRPLYTKKVSQKAARHWQQMANDESQLHWQEDYLIFKSDRDNVISLYEMSGGEKVSACLAVRLAMQEVLGGFGLFILDEPTIHLDEERCDSLAQQIGAIKGLNQVIVISHDDTFHAYTQQQITIRKDLNSRASVVEL